MRRLHIVVTLFMLLGAASAAAVEREFFSPQTRMALPAPIRSFVNRYLSERIEGAAADNARRMEFDEVEVTFPLTEETAAELLGADGLSMSLHDGKRYSIVWMRDSIAAGAMSFPASYSLIHGTSQNESFKSLAGKLCSNVREAGGKVRPVAEKVDSLSVRCRPGEEFILGHMTSDTYIDAVSALPIWSAEQVEESLANLFELDNMPEVSIDLTMISYGLDSLKIVSTSSSLAYLLGSSEGCTPFFGIASKGDNGRIDATIVYHNPLYAYLHLLEVTAEPEELFCEWPRLTATLRPYVKLHNLTSLWGEKML